MRKQWFLALGLVALTLGIIGFFLRNKLSPTQAKLQIAETNVPSSIFINKEQVGSTTPHEEYRKPGEITLRLVPISTNGPLAPWETKITLVNGVTTVVRRNFGPTEETSTGEVLSFEKIGGKKAELVVISNPDSSEVKLDGEPRGFTPLPIANISTGEHSLSVSHLGYKEREIKSVKTEPGYKLTAIVYLTEDENQKKQEDQVEETVKPPPQPQVKILETSTGFLRVRGEPTTVGTEVAKVTPGKQYLLVDKNNDSSWLKIEYEKGKTGWISAQYAKKVEVNSEPNGSGATGSAKPVD